MTWETLLKPQLKATHISELHQAQFSQLTDTVVGWARLEEELHQTHLLTPEKGAHDRLNAAGEVTWMILVVLLEAWQHDPWTAGRSRIWHVDLSGEQVRQ